MKTVSKNVTFYQGDIRVASILDEVLSGLSAPQKELSPKFFYDERGSVLFDKICTLPEYYVTRTEKKLLQDVIQDLPTHIDSPYSLFELGSGSSDKVRALLDSAAPEAYVCIDISADHLLKAAKSLGEDYPKVEVYALCIDYSDAWTIPLNLGKNRMAFFPGSSIGNFSPSAAEILLRQVARLVGQDGWLLIGVDLQKSPALIESAYNDSQGVTAEFNKNTLSNLNQLLDCQFSPENFEHRAFYNEQHHRIEMHLIAQKSHSVEIKGHSIDFKKGESIHTENSYKYSLDSFKSLAEASGFQSVKHWVDNEQLFSIHLCQVSDTVFD